MISPRSRLTGTASAVVRFPPSRYLYSASVVGCLFLSACDGTTSHSGSNQAVQGDQSSAALTRLWSELRLIEDIQLPPIRFPKDLAPHPDMAAESFQLQAIFLQEDGSMMSVQAQLDRLAVSVEADSSSQWGFSDIMRASVAVGESGQSVLMTRESIERGALDLANSDQQSIYVIDTRLDLQTPSDDQTDLDSSDECMINYRFSTMLFASVQNGVTDALTLEIPMRACPDSVSLQGLNRWQASALAASATLGSTDTLSTVSNDRLQGHAWLSQTWGQMPPTGGAVLIDLVNLRLTSNTDASVQLLSANRSKRKTGRGPQTVRGTISTPSEGAQTLDLQWTDEGEQSSPTTGIIYPQRFRIRNQDSSIDLLLTPVVALPEVSDMLGIRWNGAVMVSGTHTGIGFVDFKPLNGNEPSVNTEDRQGG